MATSRRKVLGAIVGGTVGFAGCAGIGGSSGATDPADSVTVLSAGSLAQTFGEYINPAFESQTGITVQGEYYGTNAVMRMVEDGTKYPDVIVSADATLLRDRLYEEYTDWDIAFATNTLGVGYNQQTAFGQHLAAGTPWYDLARNAEEGAIAIGDPDLDPLGYRAVQAFQLAEREHDLDGFTEEMMAVVYEEPEEPQIMAGVETGARAAAIVYHNMAVDHGMPFHEFPAAYNFGNPELADHYATVTYTTDEEGYTAEGRPILYNMTVRKGADAPTAGRQLVQFCIDNPDMLRDAGLTVSESMPRANGAVPDTIQL